MTKGILYYTNNKLNMRFALKVRHFIANSGFPVTSVSSKPTVFGNNISINDSEMTNGEAMAKKIITGLMAMKEDVVYFCEADVLYHPNHFEFTPPEKGVFYYNGNYWFVRLPDGFAIHYNVSPLSGLVVDRLSAIKHFQERVELINKEGFSLKIGFEPMTHKRINWNFFVPFEVFNPKFPNVDITHGGNVSYKRWSQDRFRKKPTFWEESDYKKIPGWPDLPQILSPWLT